MKKFWVGGWVGGGGGGGAWPLPASSMLRHWQRDNQYEDAKKERRHMVTASREIISGKI